MVLNKRKNNSFILSRLFFRSTSLLYENESYLKEIKSALKQDEKDFKILLDERYPFRTISSVLKGTIGPKDKDGECPKCGKKIPLITGDKCKCPNVVGNFMLL